MDPGGKVLPPWGLRYTMTVKKRETQEGGGGLDTLPPVPPSTGLGTPPQNPRSAGILVQGQPVLPGTCEGGTSDQSVLTELEGTRKGNQGQQTVLHQGDNKTFSLDFWTN